jgi:hypothetical protein
MQCSTSNDVRCSERLEIEISELKRELLASHQCIDSNHEVEANLREENRMLRSRAHLAMAREHLRILQDNEMQRNISLEKELEESVLRISKKTVMYKVMLADLKDKNRRLVETIQMRNILHPTSQMSATKRTRKQFMILLVRRPKIRRGRRSCNAAA